MSNPLNGWAGVLQVSDLSAGAQIHLQRPVLAGAWMQKWLAGHSTQVVPGMVSALFALCSSAHRVTSQRVLACASTGESVRDTAMQVASIRLETAREHVRRMLLDWPGQGVALTLSSRLHADCPLWQAQPDDPNWSGAARRWLDEHWLGCNGGVAQSWRILQTHAPHEGLNVLADHLRDCAQGCAGQVGQPQWLQSWLLHQNTLQDWAVADPAAVHWAWDAQGQAVQGQWSAFDLAQQLSERPNFAQQPHGQGGAALETGPWLRWGDGSVLQRPLNAWTRLLGRWADLCRVLMDEAQPALQHGVIACGAGQALAWTEMARGVLVHWAKVKQDGSQVTVQDYRVVAPTEWNAHPQGALAQAVSRVRELALCQRVLAAFDPCVPVQFDNKPEASCTK